MNTLTRPGVLLGRTNDIDCCNVRYMRRTPWDCCDFSYLTLKGAGYLRLRHYTAEAGPQKASLCSGGSRMWEGGGYVRQNVWGMEVPNWGQRAKPR